MIRTIYFIAGLGLYSIINIFIFVPFVFITSLIHKDKSIAISKKFVKVSCKFVIFLTGSKVEVIYKDSNIIEDIKDKPIILVANHQSHMDAPLILGFIDKYVGFIAKKELEKIKFTSFWMKQIQCVFIDRSNVRDGLKSIKQGAEKIKSGYSVAIFPEGTRSKNGSISEFKKGSFKLAEYSGAAILPVTIKGSKEILESGTLKIKKATDVKIIIDKTIDLKNLNKEDNKNIHEYVKNIIEENYKLY